jgi:hypothetical protein
MRNLSFILSTLLFLFSAAASHAQESINAGSGDITDPEINLSYSIGQVLMEPVIYSEGSVTPGIQQPYEISLLSGVPEVIAGLKIQAYPNPATDYLELSFPDYDKEKHTLRLIDQTGKVIFLTEIIEAISRMNVHALAPGVYFLQIAEKEQMLKTFKIIKN